MRLRWLFCFLILLLVGGCGFKDLDKRFFVLAMGVDRLPDAEETYKVILQLGIPSAKIEPGQSNSQIIVQTADSITEAVRLIKSKVDKELDFGHVKVIVFGEELAKKGFTQTVDWFVRRRDIQKVAFMGLGSPTAEEIIKLQPKSEQVPGNALYLSFGQTGTESAYIITEYLFDFYTRLYEPGQDPYLPVIGTNKEKDSYVIERVALFDKKKLKTILDPDQTRVLNTLLRTFDKVDIQSEQKGKHRYFMSVQEFKVDYSISRTPAGNAAAKFNIFIKGIAEESASPLYNEDWKMLGEMTSRAVEKRSQNLLKKLQALNVDPIGLGLHYRAVNHRENAWKEWQELYKNMEFVVNVDVKLQGTGSVK